MTPAVPPPSPAPAASRRRPVRGALALASLLALTACAGGAEEPAAAPDGTAATAPREGASDPAPSGAASGPSPAAGGGTSAPGGEPAERTAAPDPGDGSTGAATDRDGGPDGAAAGDGPAEGDAPAGDAADRPEGSAAAIPPAGAHRADGVCRLPDLDVAAAPAGGAAGSVWVELTVTNTGPDPCRVAGYPGVSFVDGTGAQIGAAAERDTGVPGTGGTLAPGGSATAALRIGQAAVHAGCEARPAAGLRVYPPENTSSVVVPLPVQACAAPGVQQLEVQGFGG
ncbi:hypothetical protein AUQ48_06875 [Kocuria flava]|uniref:DUF4232 domain-containing protein n=1 Tax=Kocuria flava TaxID=446860 RepID=A0A2N4T1B0_9MICC|nr:DUF4232 domain-containing protein [Kocuria flava]PLC12003.1 hypothetical protein AUQ48_06875 [Kocuria flava]